MKCKFTFAVNSGHESASVPVESHVHPGRRMARHGIEIGYAYIHGMHATAHELPDRATLADVMEAK